MGTSSIEPVLNRLVSEHTEYSDDEIEISQIRTHIAQAIVHGEHRENTLPLAT